MADCIFCKISEREIPSADVYEDSDFFAFLDINPVAKGHTILIPKTHIRWMKDANDELISKIFITSRNLMNKIKDSLGCDYVFLSVAGEEVAHFHIHLVPRYFHDKIATFTHVTYESPEEREEYLTKIKG